MPRPRRRRRICGRPQANIYKPVGIRKRELEKLVLALDEFEAIRLKFHQGLDQKTAAKKMDLSQPTFHRLLDSGCKKIAEALVEGKVIEIESGTLEL